MGRTAHVAFLDGRTIFAPTRHPRRDYRQKKPAPLDPRKVHMTLQT